jgi:hypothetical protein
MKRGILILTLGLIAAVTGYCCIYLAGTSSARNLRQSEKPELAWLRQEFNLSDAEFKRVSGLHMAYLPHCREMCRQIDAQNAQLQTLLANATNMTPQIDNALAEASRLRSECQSMMLRQFFQVSQTLPPEQGRRYLSWVKKKAFVADHGMNGRP